MHRPHRFTYKFSDDPELEKIERQYFGAAAKGSSRHYSYWLYKTAIFHYSHGTNRCSVEGCLAPIEALTLEHEQFDRETSNTSLGIGAKVGGPGLAKALINAGFPDINITVKCMLHNAQNVNPKAGGRAKDRSHIDPNYTKVCSICKLEKNSSEFSLNANTKDKLLERCKICHHKYKADKKLQAFKLYGYDGDPTGMTFEHSNNDGYIHRRYLMSKYNVKSELTGQVLAFYLLKEHKAGVPNWPGLIIVDANANHLGMKQYRRDQRD